MARAWGRGEHPSGLALWRQLAKLGVTALAIPESHDGLGATAMDLVVAFEELGHHAVPGPLVESIAVAPLLAPPQWLPRLASGEVIATVAPWYLDADIADLVLGGTPGALAACVDRTRRLFPAAGDLTEPAFNAGVLACAAQLSGLGRALLEMSVSYAKSRVQFGQPIGQLQAIKHRLAEVLIALDFARPLLYAAAFSGTARDISAAKVACGDAAYLAARTALQVHGAIGYTEEFDLSIWFSKVRALVSVWGTPAEHRARVMAAL
ncbi:putative acyl-CoA dehydrogenase FadE [Rhizocola hellebori]|uniref:Putative acyl-CoA dehydrogenase FadE n=2 Tax=Rhizocola hellebori TaxID=1392758 RepID=A0A8J3QAN4_9ACTN|nr:putative acyl-CoA dehydrogenase FadE [Rhizocola hellebori]